MNNKYDLDILLSPQYFDDERSLIKDQPVFIILYYVIWLTDKALSCVLFPARAAIRVLTLFERLTTREDEPE